MRTAHLFSIIQILSPIIVPPCNYCNTKRFQHGTKGFSCLDGETLLVTNDVLEELFDLYTSHSEEAIEFWKYIRSYNKILLSHLSVLIMIKIYIKEVEGNIHLRYMVMYIISLMNYCLQIILHGIYNFIFMNPRMKFKTVCVCQVRFIHLFWKS